MGESLATSCVPCAAGKYCIENDGAAYDCPRGHFCPVRTLAPIPCFPGKYNPDKGKSESAHCLDCPKGYYCDRKGIENYLDFECPRGHYCPNEPTTQLESYPCPAGTYRNDTGATNRTHACWGCPEGYYCPRGSILPTPCDFGYQCPANSSEPVLCPPGTYCPQLNVAPFPCPAGFFCPSYRTDNYTKCVNGTYCGEG